MTIRKYEGAQFRPRYSPKTSTFLQEKVTNLIKPVLFTNKALVKQNLYIGLTDTEVSWLGTVDESDEHYLVDDVFLIGQEVTGTTTDINAEDLSKFFEDLEKEVGEDEMGELNNRMRYWGHSHVTMDIKPSETDNETMYECFGQGGIPYFIRAIGNKLGELSVDVFHYESGHEFRDVPWWPEEVNITDALEEITAELDTKVIEKKAVVTVGNKKKSGKNFGNLNGDDSVVTLKTGKPKGSSFPWYSGGKKFRTSHVLNFLGVS
jgi:hypothetical protein